MAADLITIHRSESHRLILRLLNSCDLVLPGKGEPLTRGHLDELLHLCGHVSHISWAAEDDGVGRVELIKVCRCFFGSAYVSLDACNEASPAVNGFGLKLCMAEATMINGVNNCHKSKVVWRDIASCV